jgi:hypothetical protein
VPLGALMPGDEIVIRREGLTYGASLRRDRALAHNSEGLRSGSI